VIARSESRRSTTPFGRAARTLALAFLAAGYAALAPGCALHGPAVSLAPPVERFAATDYDRVRGRWTRGEGVIKGLDTTLQVNATMLAPELIAAQVPFQAHLFKLSAEEREKLRATLEHDWSSSFPFFVAAATSHWRWNDFERKQSVWHIALVNSSGEEVAPSSVVAFSEITPTITSLYPYTGLFARAYVLRFPKQLPDGRPLAPPGTHRLTLRFAGPLGIAELVWKLH
jgi:hypothetical protein